MSTPERRLRIPEHPALAEALADFDHALYGVSLALVNQAVTARIDLARLMRKLTQRGIADTALFPERSRALTERILAALYSKAGDEPATFVPMALGAWLTAYAFAQELEGCPTCGEFAADPHAPWCTQRPTHSPDERR